MGGQKKEYLPLPSVSQAKTFLSNNKPITVLGAAFAAFASVPQIERIVITVPSGEEKTARACLSSEAPEGRVFFVQGGSTRRESVYRALKFLEEYRPSHILIHDGARPWIKPELIERCMEGAVLYGAVIPALPLVETPKEVETSKELEVSKKLDRAGETIFIKRHLKRTAFCGAQTPQAFTFSELLLAHEKAAERAEKENIEYTDDAEIWGEFTGQVAAIAGDPENRKITFPEDICKPGVLQMSQDSAMDALDGNSSRGTTAMRIGLGRDLHRLAAGRRFLLGGVEIPFEKGELGHSDGDVLAHAVCDALIGAAGLADLGELYPSEAEVWKDADSLELLKGAWEKLKKENWCIVNLDCTVSCEKPKILPYRESIRRSLAAALDIDRDLVFLKGKTNEGLGPIGTGDAVEALVVCLIVRGEQKEVS
jgi:2-C-methyl-D-erythritol 4-phosphate cytidylyltransferase/2-C-methyl-D-erythritol 2,4-cyclodiphosphate synthase